MLALRSPILLIFFSTISLYETGCAKEIDSKNFKKCTAENRSYVIFEYLNTGSEKDAKDQSFRLSKSAPFFIGDFDLQSIPFKPKSIPMIPDRYPDTPRLVLPSEGVYWVRLLVTSFDLSDDIIGYRVSGEKIKENYIDIYFSHMEDLGRCDKLKIGFELNKIFN